MSYYKSFGDITPPPRYGTSPGTWTHVEVQESDLTPVSWSTIATVAVVPGGTPAAPDDVNVSVNTAVFETGLYRLRFVDAGSNPSSWSSPTVLPSPTVVEYAPSVDEVARMIPSRAAGRFTGGTDTPPLAFPDNTRVQQVIDLATATISARLGGARLPEKFFASAKALIVLRTMLLLEPTAWPEQSRPDKSAWDQWWLLYKDELPSLIELVHRDAEDGDSGDGGPETTGWLPAGGFPAPGPHYPGSRPGVSVGSVGWPDWPAPYGFPCGSQDF